jgi:hypothetical protein
VPNIAFKFNALVDTLMCGGVHSVCLFLSLAVWIGCSSGEGTPLQRPVEQQRSELIEMLESAHGLERALRLGRLLETATPEEMAAYRDVFESREAIPREADLSLFTLRWAEVDPAAALEWAITVTSPLDWSQRASILREWALSDPEAAARAARPLKGTSYATGQCLSAVAEGWLYSGRPGLDVYVAGLDREFQQEVMGNLVELVSSRRGPEALMDWSEGFQVGGKAKLNLYRKTALMLGRSSPDHAQEWVARHSPEGEMSNLIKLAASGWATHDGPGMVAWIETLAASRERDWGLEEGFKRWLREDREEASKWIQAAQYEEWADPAHLVYSGRISNEDALAGIEWAARIQREKIRDRALGRIVRRWRIRDAPAAMAWLEAQTGFSDSLREKMLATQGRVMR